MVAVGLGGKSGARNTHRSATETGFAHVARQTWDAVCGRVDVAGALAIVENAVGRVAELHGIPAASVPEREPQVLARATELMPRLPVSELDLLIIDEIGKNVSGTGFDTNLTGRKTDSPCFVRRILVRGLTAETLGNACGIGLADVITRRAADAIDPAATALNTRVSGLLDRARIPMIADSDREAVDVALDSVARHATPPRIAWIRNTCRLARIYVSESCLDQLLPHAAVAGPAASLRFDRDGRLLDRARWLDTPAPA
jgi:hypothetical protein